MGRNSELKTHQGDEKLYEKMEGPSRNTDLEIRINIYINARGQLEKLERICFGSM